MSKQLSSGRRAGIDSIRSEETANNTRAEEAHIIFFYSHHV